MWRQTNIGREDQSTSGHFASEYNHSLCNLGLCNLIMKVGRSGRKQQHVHEKQVLAVSSSQP